MEGLHACSTIMVFHKQAFLHKSVLILRTLYVIQALKIRDIDDVHSDRIVRVAESGNRSLLQLDW